MAKCAQANEWHITVRSSFYTSGKLLFHQDCYDLWKWFAGEVGATFMPSNIEEVVGQGGGGQR